MMLEHLPQTVVDLGVVTAGATAVVSAVAVTVRTANRVLTDRISEIHATLMPNGGASVGDMPARLTDLEAGIDESLRALCDRLDRLEERTELLKFFISERRRAEKRAGGASG